MRARGIFVSIATIGLMVGPAFANGVLSSVAGARQECTITGTAADDDLNGTTKDDVICGKAGSDSINGLEGNDVIRGGQGDDGSGTPLCVDNGGGGAPIRRGEVCIIFLGPFGLNGIGHRQGSAGRRLDRGTGPERRALRRERRRLPRAGLHQ
jgi:hypothetical protein